MAPFPGLLLPIDPTVPNVPVPSCTILPCYVDLNISTAAVTTTNNTITSFTSAPNGRGTIGIFWSCLFTLYASFWSVLHLNIPSTKDSRTTTILRTIKWMIITAIAPEYTYLVANGQREVAKRSLVQIKEAREISLQIMVSNFHAPEWTITHMFFAEMGGFRLRYFRASQSGDDETGSGSLTSARLMHLPVSGIDIAYLLRNEIIRLPSITREEIKERSKADSFAKIVACCQLLWLVIQSVARACQNLPVTQLELVTLLDAFCALLTYIAWFHKPYKLTSAADVDIDVIGNLSAEVEEALMAKRYSYQIWTKNLLPRLNGPKQDRVPNAFPLSVGTEFLEIHDDEYSDDTGIASTYYTADNSSGETVSEQQRSREHERLRTGNLDFRQNSISEAESKEKTGDERHGRALGEACSNNEKGHSSRPNSIAAEDEEEENEQEDARENGDQEEVGRGEEDVENEGDDSENRPEIAFLRTASQQPDEENAPASSGGPKLFNIGLLSPWIFTLLMCMSFGALHCIMWTRVFPTVIEQILWRISSLAITLAVPLYLFFAYSGVALASNTPTIILFTGLYALARLYIIVEAFASLRAQPSEVYEDIDWTKFLPHF